MKTIIGSNREVIEGLQVQGATVVRVYTIDVSNVAGTPSGTPTLTVYDEKDGENVTATVASGSCSLSGSIITTPTISSLRPDRTYYCVVLWSIGGGKFEDVFFRVRCDF
jgi:hypothetical protein